MNQENNAGMNGETNLDKIDDPKSIERIRNCYEFLRQKINELAQAKMETGIKDQKELNTDELLSDLKVELVPMVYKWMHKESFTNVCKMTAAFEGEIVRALKQLDDLSRQMTDAMQAIGNEDLCQKFLEAQNLIHHGIVFAASLYVEEVENTGNATNLANDVTADVSKNEPVQTNENKNEPTTFPQKK